jgi:membrane-bound metal-dependent hydrolase YbcI (DUF457 family)
MPIYLGFKSKIDPLPLLISFTFVDIEPLYFLLIGESNDHGILHSYFAILLFSVLIVFIMYFAEHRYENKLWSVYGKLRLNPERVKYPLLSVYLTFLVGGFSHIFFDMLTHKSLPYVFYPITLGNPFYLGQASIVVDVIVAVVALCSVFWWLRLQKRGSLKVTTSEASR